MKISSSICPEDLHKPCPRHHEGQHHVQTPWSHMQDLTQAPINSPAQILLLTLTLHGARMVNSLVPSDVGLGLFFFSVPLLRSPCTLSSRQPLLFVLRYHLGPSVWAFLNPAPLSLGAFFSYWGSLQPTVRPGFTQPLVSPQPLRICLKKLLFLDI